MYNASCWAATSAVPSKLDICHRKHLRSILNVQVAQNEFVQSDDLLMGGGISLSCYEDILHIRALAGDRSSLV